MASLLNVPVEILLHISSYLTTPEFGNFRGSCKHIETSLFHIFAFEFFSKRQFALVDFSIQALVDISKSRLGPYLTHVIISLQHPQQLSNFRLDVPESVKHNHYHAEFLNHCDFIATGLDVDMLSDAFKNLPNLETIGMRDFMSSSRHRDGTSWTSYGVPTFEAKTNRKMGLPTTVSGHSTHGYTSHVFLTILRAMANGAASSWNPKLTRMEILLHTCALPDRSFNIPKHLESGVSLALSKLKTLFVDHLTDTPSFSPRTRDVHDSNLKPDLTPGFFLSRFLVKMPALEHLRLNFQLYKPESTMKFLSWLSGTNGHLVGDVAVPTDSLELANLSDSLPLEFPSTPTFSNLTALDIGMAIVEKPVLLALYTKHKTTLKSVGLHKTTLTKRGLRGEDLNLWARLCNEMAEADLQLNMLSLSYIKQHKGKFVVQQSSGVPIMFTGPKHARTWKGTAFAQSVKDIISDMVFSSPGDSGSSDDDNDDDTMDDV